MSSFDPTSLDKFPTESGVYLMKNREKKVIYVGKAIHLKNRLKQYFSKKGDGRAMIPLLVAEIDTIDTLIVPNEKEALLLENTLIKKHRPKYNALLKDDKTFISLFINHKHPWPMIRLIRTKEGKEKNGLYFGPYTSAFAARQTLDLLQRLFPLRQCSDEELKRRTRPCLLYSIKRCLAPCVQKCSKEEYHTFVHSAVEFLKGHDKTILADLKKEMQKASDALEFEKAAALLQTIRQIEHVTEKRGLVAKGYGKSCDVLGLYREGDEAILMQLFFREGKLVGSEHTSFSNLLQTDEELFSSFLLQYYHSSKNIPEEIILPLRLPQADLLSSILGCPLLVPKIGEKKKMVSLAFDNAHSTFHKEKDHAFLREKLLLDLQETLHLQRYPARIECFDTSHSAGTDFVASLIAFTQGEKDRKRTRLFKIKTAQKGDDYGALREALERRLKRGKEENDLPDLLIIDGGKGQLSSALTVLKELNIITIDVIALAKEEGRHDRGMTLEKIHLPHHPDPVTLDSRSPLLFLLQKIRDETHRLALNFHRKRLSKRMLSTGLDELAGIGPVKKKRLLQHFGSLKKIQEATAEELLQVEGISNKDVKILLSKSR